MAGGTQIHSTIITDHVGRRLTTIGIILMKMRKKIENDEWKTAADESCRIDQIEFENLIKEFRGECNNER